MIIKLDNYNDLGKCAMGTLLDEFDTEKDHIYLQIKEIDIENIKDCYAEIKINSAKDLCNWLWNIAGISTGSKDGHTWYFHECKDWWHAEYDESIANNKIELEKLNKKLAKTTDSKKIKQLKSQIEFINGSNLETMLIDLNNRKNEKIKLITKQKLTDAQ